MIQVCDPPRQRQVRRLSAEEFFTLVRCGGAGFYRPRSEVLRMLTAGEAWGTAGAALLVLPLTADTAAAAALRNWLGRRQLEGRCLLTPEIYPLLENTKPGAGGEIQLTDAMARSLDREAMYAVVIDPLSGYDTGTPSGWMATNALMAASDPRFASAFWDAIDERGGLMRK